MEIKGHNMHVTEAMYFGFEKNMYTCIAWDSKNPEIVYMTNITFDIGKNNIVNVWYVHT